MQNIILASSFERLRNWQSFLKWDPLSKQVRSGFFRRRSLRSFGLLSRHRQRHPNESVVRFDIYGRVA